jgi:hypothetical protein
MVWIWDGRGVVNDKQDFIVGASDEEGAYLLWFKPSYLYFNLTQSYEILNGTYIIPNNSPFDVRDLLNIDLAQWSANNSLYLSIKARRCLKKRRGHVWPYCFLGWPF